MQEDYLISDDPGTILDSYTGVQKPMPAVAASSPVAAVPRPATTSEALYRSPHRWAAPRILVCDDGSLDDGETFYMRSEKITIGRAKGDIVIGHDLAMSGIHAEIARREAGGKPAWVLRDLGSSNGTLVRARTLTLRSGITIQLGSKRYRFEHPGGAPTGKSSGEDPRTVLLDDLRVTPSDMLPALMECISTGDTPPVRYTFRTTRVTIGRPNCGNDVAIDDLCLTGLHAVANRDVTGTWHLESQPSLNGIWVKIDTVRLTDNCLFQCGEQRFRFWA